MLRACPEGQALAVTGPASNRSEDPRLRGLRHFREKNRRPQGRGSALLSSPAGFIGDERRYRFTETCLIAERDHIVLGACLENPTPRDEHDRNLIAESNTVSDFLITFRTEKLAAKRLRLIAFALVMGGGALMIAAVAWALGELGLF